MLVPLSVGDLMTEDVETVGPAATVRAVAERLHGSDIGSLVVTDGERPVGIVTERDLVGVLARAFDPDETLVERVMTGDLVTVPPEATAEQAARLLAEGGFRRLPVVENEELVGIVTTTDLSRYLPRLSERERHATDPVPEQGPAAETYEEADWAFEYEDEGESEGTVAVGDVVRFRKVIDESDVEAFARATGDTNRLHLDDEFAARTRFGGRIAHGTLTVGVISAALARLPGVTVYLGQDVRYLGPVEPGETVTAVCEVTEALGGDRYRLTTTVYDGSGEAVVDGEATVLIDDLPEGADRQAKESV